MERRVAGRLRCGARRSPSLPMGSVRTRLSLLCGLLSLGVALLVLNMVAGIILDMDQSSTPLEGVEACGADNEEGAETAEEGSESDEEEGTETAEEGSESDEEEGTETAEEEDETNDEEGGTL